MTTRSWTSWVTAAALSAAVALVLGWRPAQAGEPRQIVEGVAIYLGMVPAELVRGHPREHPESEMHGGVAVGESHLMVALFDARTGERITRAKVTATITGADAKIDKPLEPMTVAGAATYGNYVYLTGHGPYRIELQVLLPGQSKPLRARFEWARS